MFYHNFKYTIKTLFHNKMLLFWTFAFPIILGTFFSLAFSNIENSEKRDIIDIAIVEDDSFQNSRVWKEVFKTLGDEENQDRLFRIQYVEMEKAKQLLEEKKVIGYLKLDETAPQIVVRTNGIEETIFKYVVEEIDQTTTIVQYVANHQLALKDYEKSVNLNSLYAKIYKEVLEMIEENKANIEDISSGNLSYTMIEFYTLIAMTCLYGGILGIVAINRNLANMSATGKRVSVSPTSKRQLIFSSVLASFLIQLIGLALLFMYTIFILHIDYGNNIPLIILLALSGSLSGLALGIFIACVFKMNDNIKTGILIAVTMLGCFLSGMMGITMKYIVDKNLPFVNRVNPASMITDGFYSLYYYDTFDRYYLNVVSLLIFAFIMINISVFCLRRQKYDSI